MKNTSTLNSFSRPVKLGIDIAQRAWIRYQLWNTEVELDSIESERRQLEDEARKAILLRAHLTAALRGDFASMSR